MTKCKDDSIVISVDKIKMLSDSHICNILLVFMRSWQSSIHFLVMPDIFYPLCLSHSLLGPVRSSVHVGVCGVGLLSHCADAVRCRLCFPSERDPMVTSNTKGSFSEEIRLQLHIVEFGRARNFHSLS